MASGFSKNLAPTEELVESEAEEALQSTCIHWKEGLLHCCTSYLTSVVLSARQTCASSCIPSRMHDTTTAPQPSRMTSVILTMIGKTADAFRKLTGDAMCRGGAEVSGGITGFFPIVSCPELHLQKDPWLTEQTGETPVNLRAFRSLQGNWRDVSWLHRECVEDRSFLGKIVLPPGSRLAPSEENPVALHICEHYAIRQVMF